MAILDNLRKIKSPLMLLSLPVLSGAVYHAFSEMHGESPELAAISALIAVFSDMGMHLLTHELHEAFRERRGSARDILENEHLTHAVGITIAALLYEAAENNAYAPADRRRLEAIAHSIEAHWDGVPVRNDAAFADISSFKLPDFLTGDANAFLQVRALTPEAWQYFLLSDQWWDGKEYFSGTDLDSKTVQAVAEKLHTQFARALFDALAADAVKHGEAYSKMVLLMLGENLFIGRQLLTDTGDLLIGQGETLTLLKQLLAAQTPGNNSRVDEILNLLKQLRAEQPPVNNSQVDNRHEADLHQKYLARVIDTVGRLTLANINPDASTADGAPLEEIYVDLPTECLLRAEVKDARVTDWWVGRGDQGADRAIDLPAEDRQARRQEDRTRSQRLQDVDKADLQSLIDKAEKEDLDEGVPLSASALVSACRRLVVLGAPGSGKSTLVRYLALCLAGEARELWTRTADLSRLPGWTHGPLTPIYIELRRFVGSSHFPDLDNKPVVEDLWNYIRTEILDHETQAYESQLKKHLIGGQALLILDGLDEVPYLAGEGNLARRQQQIRALAQVLDDNYGASRIVVTSRLYAYNHWELDGYTPIHVAAFAGPERIELAANLYRVSRYQQPEEKAQRLNSALGQQEVSSELADNPLFLTLMATLFARSENGEGLPTRKGALYHASVLLLLKRWTEAKAGNRKLRELLGSSNRDDLLARLAKLAYRVHYEYGAEDHGATPEIPEEWLFVLFKMNLKDPNVKPGELLFYLSENTGLLESPGHKGDEYVFRFAHRTFQEYLAAKHLVEVECAKGFKPVRELIVRQPDLWRTPCLLVGDVLRDIPEGNPYDKLWKLVGVLLGGRPENAVPNPRWWPVWLAAGIAQEQQLYDQTDLEPADELVRDWLVGWLVKLVETPGSLVKTDGACALQERAQCGRVLGLLGDPRPGVRLRSDDVPEIEWGEAVPPGRYPVGGDTDAWNSLPADTVHLAYRYRLAKYPVTNSQFQAFVDAGAAGYNNPVYWTPAGLEWKSDRSAPEETGEGSFGLANHPRVNVSWYEALAFCRWLSARYQELNLLEAGEAISLPTQIEWEICARGASGRLFPYGDEFDTAKGNVFGTGIGATSAVGIFPEGASPYGVLDMSGNVWEWCMTAYEDGSNDPLGAAARVVRGGAWYGGGNLARACARDGNHARFNLDDLGFRVVCLPHSVKRS